jgi:hypothetical protein
VTTSAQWRVAFARQAKADLDAREALLQHPELPQCQQLHFLQMACEKVCKAHLCGTPGVDPATLQASHAYTESVLPTIVRQQFAVQSRHRPRDRSWLIAAIRKLARKIELLAPSVRAGGSHPANCEYPWVGADGAVRVPAEHNFNLDLLHEPGGRHLIKALYGAVEQLSGEVD